LTDVHDPPCADVKVPIEYEVVSAAEFRAEQPEGTPEHIKDDLEDALTGGNELGCESCGFPLSSTSIQTLTRVPARLAVYVGQDIDWVVPYLARPRTSFAQWCAKTDLSGYAA